MGSNSCCGATVCVDLSLEDFDVSKCNINDCPPCNSTGEVHMYGARGIIGECIKCPTDGYKSRSDTECIRCNNPDWCKDNTCAAGHTGPGCAICEQGWFMGPEGCEQCGSGSEFMIFVGIILLLVIQKVLIKVASVKDAVGAASAEDALATASSHKSKLAVFSTVLTYFQVQGIMLTFDVGLPHFNFASLPKFLGWTYPVLNLSLVQVSQPECAVRMTAQSKLILTALVPLGYLIWDAYQFRYFKKRYDRDWEASTVSGSKEEWLVLQTNIKREKLNKLPITPKFVDQADKAKQVQVHTKYLVAAVLTANATYVSAWTVHFNASRCEKSITGSHVLVAHPEVSCEDHGLMFFMAVFIILYVVLIQGVGLAFSGSLFGFCSENDRKIFVEDVESEVKEHKEFSAARAEYRSKIKAYEADLLDEPPEKPKNPWETPQTGQIVRVFETGESRAPFLKDFYYPIQDAIKSDFKDDEIWFYQALGLYKLFVVCCGTGVFEWGWMLVFVSAMLIMIVRNAPHKGHGSFSEEFAHFMRTGDVGNNVMEFLLYGNQLAVLVVFWLSSHKIVSASMATTLLYALYIVGLLFCLFQLERKLVGKGFRKFFNSFWFMLQNNSMDTRKVEPSGGGAPSSEVELTKMERGKDASQLDSTTLKVLNPPESARTYSAAPPAQAPLRNGTLVAPSSMLDVLVAWSWPTSDALSWVAIDLGESAALDSIIQGVIVQGAITSHADRAFKHIVVTKFSAEVSTDGTKWENAGTYTSGLVFDLGLTKLQKRSKSRSGTAKVCIDPQRKSAVIFETPVKGRFLRLLVNDWAPFLAEDGLPRHGKQDSLRRELADKTRTGPRTHASLRCAVIVSDERAVIDRTRQVYAYPDDRVVILPKMSRPGPPAVIIADPAKGPVSLGGLVILNPAEDKRSYSSVYDRFPPGKGNARSMLDSEAAWVAGSNIINYDGTPAPWMVIDLDGSIKGAKPGTLVQVHGIVVQGKADQYVDDVVTEVRIDTSIVPAASDAQGVDPEWTPIEPWNDLGIGIETGLLGSDEGKQPKNAKAIITFAVPVLCARVRIKPTWSTGQGRYPKMRCGILAELTSTRPGPALAEGTVDATETSTLSSCCTLVWTLGAQDPLSENWGVVGIWRPRLDNGKVFFGDVAVIQGSNLGPAAASELTQSDDQCKYQPPVHFDLVLFYEDAAQGTAVYIWAPAAADTSNFVPLGNVATLTLEPPDDKAGKRRRHWLAEDFPGLRCVHKSFLAEVAPRSATILHVSSAPVLWTMANQQKTRLPERWAKTVKPTSPLPTSVPGLTTDIVVVEPDIDNAPIPVGGNVAMVNPPQDKRHFSSFSDGCDTSMLDAKHSWSPEKSRLGEWLVIDLEGCVAGAGTDGSLVPVHGTVVQGRHGAYRSQFVTKLQVDTTPVCAAAEAKGNAPQWAPVTLPADHESGSGIDAHTYYSPIEFETNLLDPTSGKQAGYDGPDGARAVIKFPTPVLCARVRVKPTAWNNYASMRCGILMELPPAVPPVVVGQRLVTWRVEPAGIWNWAEKPNDCGGFVKPMPGKPRVADNTSRGEASPNAQVILNEIASSILAAGQTEGFVGLKRLHSHHRGIAFYTSPGPARNHECLGADSGDAAEYVQAPHNVLLWHNQRSGYHSGEFTSVAWHKVVAVYHLRAEFEDAATAGGDLALKKYSYVLSSGYHSQDGGSMSIWRPNLKPGQVFFGDVFVKGGAPPGADQPLVLAADDKAKFQAPAGFERIFDLQKYGTGFFWAPVPADPENFAALGDVATQTSTVPSEIPGLRCVHKSLLRDMQPLTREASFCWDAKTTQVPFWAFHAPTPGLFVFAGGNGPGGRRLTADWKGTADTFGALKEEHWDSSAFGAAVAPYARGTSLDSRGSEPLPLKAAVSKAAAPPKASAPKQPTIPKTSPKPLPKVAEANAAEAKVKKDQEAAEAKAEKKKASATHSAAPKAAAPKRAAVTKPEDSAPREGVVGIPTGLTALTLSGGASSTGYDVRCGNPGGVGSLVLTGGALAAKPGFTVTGLSFAYRYVVGYSGDPSRGPPSASWPRRKGPAPRPCCTGAPSLRRGRTAGTARATPRTTRTLSAWTCPVTSASASTRRASSRSWCRTTAGTCTSRALAARAAT